MNLDTMINQPALYMNKSLKRAFSLISKKTDESSNTCDSLIKSSQEKSEKETSKTLVQTNSKESEKDQIFAEIKNLLENF